MIALPLYKLCGNFILPRGEKSLWIFYSSVQLDFTINLQKFGTLYLDGKPVSPGLMYTDKANVSFGSAVPGYELYWKPIPDTSSFILSGPALLCISWRQLRDLGFVRGRAFEMDGKVYMVRLPRLGVAPPEKQMPLEGIQFWGEETFIGFNNKKPEQRCPIGSAAANSWGYAHPSERRPDLGFVPVLDEGI